MVSHASGPGSTYGPADSLPHLCSRPALPILLPDSSRSRSSTRVAWQHAPAGPRVGVGTSDYDAALCGWPCTAQVGPAELGPHCRINSRMIDPLPDRALRKVMFFFLNHPAPPEIPPLPQRAPLPI